MNLGTPLTADKIVAERAQFWAKFATPEIPRTYWFTADDWGIEGESWPPRELSAVQRFWEWLKRRWTDLKCKCHTKKETK